ncbi:21S rRNA (-2'-O)-methyltransferase [[Emmonsia] crescens]|uniref:rRNA methyltransferase 2, mitochondrial n=1 Tax=[Emmonsia] crescens TaxID=73230 RepID=A0A2B7ZBD8_9EURO|nr:21S rRNA (-2'-O)-methyltransferase [Emmonsia crescens]
MKLLNLRSSCHVWLPKGKDFWGRKSQEVIEISKRYASSKRWQARQAKDKYSREATVKGLKSRAAFKLLQINDKHKIFKPGQSVVDLGYAPGSWSQVAVDLTQPNGRVVGVDIIPAQPPKGVSTIQGNFLSPQIQAYVQEFLRNPNRGRAQSLNHFENADPHSQSKTDGEIEETEGYIDRERSASSHISQVDGDNEDIPDIAVGDKTVDVVLSDMSAPWDQTTGFWKKSLSDPYHRMMNTSGMSFRDHAGSMDLCRAALEFSFNVLKTGGHFVCKFYQGAEDKALERQLKELFQAVHREKPESSRGESKEAYFIGLRRKHNAVRNAVLPDN